MALYRGQTMTFAELVALGPEAEGVKFNFAGDTDFEGPSDPDFAYWKVVGGNPVALRGHNWTRGPTQPIVITVPHSGIWDPATEALPPVGAKVALQTLSAFKEYANGVILCRGADSSVTLTSGPRWEIRYNRAQLEVISDDSWKLTRLHSDSRVEDTVTQYSNATYRILAHPEVRWTPVAPELPGPISPESPGCPHCLRRNIFYNPQTGFLEGYAPDRGAYTHRTRDRDREAPQCHAFDRWVLAIRGMMSSFQVCPRCDVTHWASEIVNDICPDCRSRRGVMQHSGGTPDQFRFGAELETESISYMAQAGDIAAKRKGWQAKGDGSLRGNHAEVTTPPTWFNEAGISQFQTTVRELRRAGARATHRCGGHVHVGLEDLTYKQLGSIVEWWWLMEPAILAALPPWPGRQSFCKPFPESARRHALAYVQTPRRAYFNQINDDRYCVLNTQSLSKYGTFEFRFFNGTVHAVKATANVALAVHFMSHASKNILVPCQQAIPRFSKTREDMLKVLNSLEITNPYWRWHLLGQFQTEEDRPHGPRADLAAEAEKKRLIPPTPRRVGNRAVVITIQQLRDLGLRQFALMENSFLSQSYYETNLSERVQSVVNELEDNRDINFAYNADVPSYNPGVLAAVSYREWDRATQAMESRTAPRVSPTSPSTIQEVPTLYEEPF